MSEVPFKISSGLKDIIGRDLITSDEIAVFELVKNSYDANATEVKIIFENIHTSDAKIIIQDNGVGMNEDDLRNKWLFVAYSAKKSDDNYRDVIQTARTFVGAKGIGRFSCDRLGQKLRITTKKDPLSSKCYQLSVNWILFENDANEEFQTIPAELSILTNCDFQKGSTGTKLEILNLRSNSWNRTKDAFSPERLNPARFFTASSRSESVPEAKPAKPGFFSWLFAPPTPIEEETSTVGDFLKQPRPQP